MHIQAAGGIGDWPTNPWVESGEKNGGTVEPIINHTYYVTGTNEASFARFCQDIACGV